MQVLKHTFFVFLFLFICATSATAFPLGEGEGGEPIPEPTPSTPSTITVPSSSSTGNYSISWSPVSGAGIYKWREEQNGTWSGWSMTTATSASFTNKPNANYRYEVIACNLNAIPPCSSAKTSSSFSVNTVSIPGTVPVINLPAENPDTDGAFSISWGAAAGTVTYYEGRKKTGSVWGPWYNVAMDTSFAFTNEADGQYYYEVKACNTAGCSNSKISALMTVARSSGSSAWQNTQGSVPDASWGGDTTDPGGNNNVGALQGSGGVSGGSATYNIPIVVAPGRNGMQPSVALAYSSRSGGGIAGGFSLSSGSAITRCGQTMINDGKVIGVTYNSVTDRLCLDGQRLIPTSGSYGYSGTTYRTMMDSFARVTQYNGINSASSWFKVEHKNGRISYYGESSDSRHKQAGRSEVSSWAIKRVTDRTTLKNNIIYNYTNYGYGENLLTEIAYTGTSTSPGDRYVRFNYENTIKPAQGYEFGFLWKRTKRLLNVKTLYQSSQIREYKMAYLVSSFSGNELLQSVTECGINNACLPATTFEWNQPSNGFGRSQSSLTPDIALTKTKFDTRTSFVPTFADFNGDGHIDIKFGSYLYSDGSLLSEQSVTQDNQALEQTNLTRMGMNGRRESDYRYMHFDSNLDGRTDLSSGELLSQTSYKITSRQWNDSTNNFNITPESTNITVTCNPFETWRWVSTVQWIKMYTTESIGHCSHQAADMNGDGLMDFIVNDRRQSEAPITTRIYLRSSTDSLSFTEATDSYSHQFGKIKSFSPMDINGDGRLDLVDVDSKINTHTITVLESNWNGTSFNFQQKQYVLNGFYAWKRQSTHHWSDFNGDGLIDIAFTDNAHRVWISLNNGNGFNGPQLTSIAIPTQFEELPWNTAGENVGNSNAAYMKFMDYNRDGLQDVLIPEQMPLGWSYPCRVIQGDTIKGCRDVIYAPTGTGPDGSLAWNTHPTIMHRWQHAVKWKVMQSKVNPNGTISFDEITNTGIEGTLGALKIYDTDSDGLNDIVTTYGFNNGMNNSNASGSVTIDNSFEAQPISQTFSRGIYFYKNQATSVPDMLKRVTTGLAVENSFNYKTLFELAQNNRYKITERGNEFPYFNFTSSALFVSDSTTSDGIGGHNSKEFRYQDAKYHAQGLGFQGFKETATDDLVTGIRTTSTFYQHYPLSGKIDETRSCLLAANTNNHCSDSSTISKQKISWDIWEDGFKYSGGPISSLSQSWYLRNENQKPWLLNSGKRYYVTPNLQTSESFPTSSGHSQPLQVISTVPLYTNKVTTSFDSYGNLLHKTSLHLDKDGLRSESLSENKYIYDESNWWINKADWQTATSKAITGRSGDYAQLDQSTTTDFDKQLKTDYIAWDNNQRLPMTMISSPIQGGGHSTTVNTTYNSYGLPLTVTTKGKNYAGTTLSDRRVTTTYTADSYFVKTVANTLGHTTTTEVNATHGQASKVTDPNGQITTMTYDAFGRVKSSKAPGEPTQWVRYDWCSGVNGGGAWCPSSPGKSYRVWLEQNGSPRQLKYHDVFNREFDSLVARFDYVSNNWYRERRQFNNKGQLLWESNRFQSDAGSDEKRTYYYITDSANANDGYDALGRLLVKRSPQANDSYMTTNYAYDGFETNITVLGETTLNMSRTYNGLGQLVNTVDALNGTTKYAYDGAANPISLQDANNNTITTRYNTLGHKEWVDDPNMGKKFFWYNTLGEVDKEQDANGNVLTYRYDTLGRMDRRWTNGVYSGIWSYDSSESYGRKGMLDYEYNINTTDDRLTKYYRYATTTSGKDYLSYNWHYIYENGSLKEPHKTIYYLDNNYGRPKGMKYNTTGLTLAYDYDDRGYMTKIKNANGGYVYQEIKNLDAQGKVTSQLMTNGLITQSAKHHAATGQMTEIKSQMTAGAARLHQINYSYEGFSNLDMQYMTTASGAMNSEDYIYDNLHRLTQSNRNINTSGQNYTISYNYDAVGNFKYKSDYSAHIDSAYSYLPSGTRNTGSGGPNSVQSVALKNGSYRNFNYDNNGNLLNDDSKNISYNEFNKPLTIAKGGVTSSFSYGADLMRYKQIKTGTAGGTITTYYLDKLLEKEVQGSTIRYKHYIGDVAIQTKTGSNWDIGFTHRDRLGSVVTITDQYGNVKEHRSYDPFGKPRKGDFANPNASTIQGVTGLSQMGVTTNRGFTDHEHLDDAELIHMNGRAYDYNLGRFLSVDPFIQAPGNSQSMNPYSYIMNNPLAGTDPSGYTANCSPGTAFNCTPVLEPEKSRYIENIATGGYDNLNGGKVKCTGGASACYGTSSNKQPDENKVEKIGDIKVGTTNKPRDIHFEENAYQVKQLARLFDDLGYEKSEITIEQAIKIQITRVHAAQVSSQKKVHGLFTGWDVSGIVAIGEYDPIVGPWGDTDPAIMLSAITNMDRYGNRVQKKFIGQENDAMDRIDKTVAIIKASNNYMSDIKTNTYTGAEFGKENIKKALDKAFIEDTILINIDHKGSWYRFNPDGSYEFSTGETGNVN